MEKYPGGLFFYEEEDITDIMHLQIHAVIHLLKEHYKISFPEAMSLFMCSETYQVLKETENTLWAESPLYVVEWFLEEMARDPEK